MVATLPGSVLRAPPLLRRQEAGAPRRRGRRLPGLARPAYWATTGRSRDGPMSEAVYHTGGNQNKTEAKKIRKVVERTPAKSGYKHHRIIYINAVAKHCYTNYKP
ncbi:hypothetical protein NDU88_000866 [Pleurodeles waltl]|uniref:Uncharacterized protein n=1 Tax=Pleurodeles waltl TaxID=8319 RepID=A0AAV7KRC7_PLEWA|nr:hypothetical protein NDU88_000866 [Pleurodeles waltl]